MPEEVVDHAIVGGGISGLYCCYHLTSKGSSQKTKRIRLYEASYRLGGRIETWRIEADPKQVGVVRSLRVDELFKKGEPGQSPNVLVAEFGPMRIEPDHQPYLRTLLHALGIKAPEGSEKWTDLVPFTPYQGPPPDEPTFKLEEEEALQTTLIDLLLLALRRVFEVTTFRSVPEIHEGPEKCDSENPWGIGKPWIEGNPNERYRFDTPYAEANYFWREFRRQEYLHRKYWKRNLMQWIKLLDEPHYAQITEHAVFRGTLFRDMGFWNLFGSVLSHMATVKLRDWASFYHLLPENPSAAAWMVFWLRALKSTDALKGIRGGMDVIVNQLCEELGFKPDAIKTENRPYIVYADTMGTPGENRVGLSLHHRLVRVEEGTKNAGDDILLVFEDADRKEVKTVRVKEHVILALPKSPLQEIEFIGGEGREAGAALQKIFDTVSVIPLLKCFFVVSNPFWEDNRPASRYAHTTPTRELHYWKSADKQTGLLMVYTDRPGTRFWSDYLVSAQQKTAETGDGSSVRYLDRNQRDAKIWQWSDRGGARAYAGWESRKFENDRLLRTFLLYAQHDGAESVTADRVVAAGMHDWGLKPYQGACHAWRPGTASTEVIKYLSAFSLVGEGPGGKKREKRIHVCGEAYSDFHGFIEGSLRSAALVLTMGPFLIPNKDLTGAGATPVLPRTIIIPRQGEAADDATLKASTSTVGSGTPATGS